MFVNTHRTKFLTPVGFSSKLFMCGVCYRRKPPMLLSLRVDGIPGGFCFPGKVAYDSTQFMERNRRHNDQVSAVRMD